MYRLRMKTRTPHKMELLAEIKALYPSKSMKNIYEDIGKMSKKSAYTVKAYLHNTRKVRPNECTSFASTLSSYIGRNISAAEVRPDVFSCSTSSQIKEIEVVEDK